MTFHPVGFDRRRLPALFLLLGAVTILIASVSPLLVSESLLTSTPTAAAAVAAMEATPLPPLAPVATPPSTPAPAISLPPLPDSPTLAEPGVFLVLELTDSTDRAAVSDAFDLMRRRGLRTILFATPDVHPDFIRLAIADGHQVALRLDLSTNYTTQEIETQVAAWEALGQRLVASAGLSLALLPPDLVPGQQLADALAGLAYHLIAAGPASAGISGQVVRLQLGASTEDQLQTLEDTLSERGLQLYPHWLAAVDGDRPASEPATTWEGFRAAHVLIVDPGHTRVDVGTGIPSAEGAPQAEYWANLVRAAALQQMLQEDGWTVVLTHDDDALFDRYLDAPDIDLSGSTTRPDDAQYRANFAYFLGLRTGRLPVVISLHVDSNSSSDVRGPVFFYPPGGDETLQAQSKRLALAMEDHISAFWQEAGVTAQSRGVHSGYAEGSKGRPGSGYDILGTTHIEPAPGADVPPYFSYIAVLTESGTASHLAEGYLLATVEGNHELARAHRNAINQWMRSEVELLDHALHPRCPDISSLTQEQIAYLASVEIASGRTEERRVALTFDAGTGADLWPTLRSIFNQAGIQPTLFFTGYFARRNPTVIRQMLADGWDLQSHSDNHPDLTELSADAVQAEFIGAQETLDGILGAHLSMCLWRPPSGARNAAVRQAVAELGMLEIYWSEGGDTTGWRENVTAERVTNRVLANLRPGQIFVMHVDSEADVEALPAILREAEAQGYIIGDIWSVLTPDQILPVE